MKNLFILIVVMLPTLDVCAQLRKEYINPASGYTNVVAVTNGNVKTLYVAGQVGSGATLEEQIRSSFQGVLDQLKAGGAEFSDVVKMNTYIVNYRQEDLTLFRQVRQEMFGDQNMPANTLVGVTSLATDAIKVEMEAVAIYEIN